MYTNIKKILIDTPLGDLGFYLTITLLSLIIAIALMMYPGLNIWVRAAAAASLLGLCQAIAIRILRSSIEWRREEENYADGA